MAGLFVVFCAETLRKFVLGSPKRSGDLNEHSEFEDVTQCPKGEKAQHTQIMNCTRKSRNPRRGRRLTAVEAGVPGNMGLPKRATAFEMASRRLSLEKRFKNPGLGPLTALKAASLIFTISLAPS